MEPIETIEVSPTERITLHYDDSPENPRVWRDVATGALTYRRRGNRIDVPEEHDFPGLINDAYEALEPEDVVRWAYIFHGIRLFDDDSTFWWVDPGWMQENYPDLKPSTYAYMQVEYDVVRGDQEEYNAWCNGEVYGIQHERLTTWGKLSDDGSTLLQGDDTTRHEWEVADSVWGIYLTDGYTFEQAAHDQAYLA